MYSLPNWILPLCGGVFMDYIGYDIGLVVFSFMVVMG